MSHVKLTEKQKQFADFYLETGNATEAAVRAGYSEKTARVIGQENLLKPAIKTYIDAAIAEKDEKRIAKQDEVLEFLTNVLRGQVKEQFPLGMGMGEQSLVKKELDGKDRLRAAELLGKRYSMWVDKQQVEGQVVVFKGEESLPD
ncbi:terminase small subunit [Paenibacillus lycopersici]|uniref:terminase small subunit n=1 Tax=Paenibacillus lycopersici TaxID=2704462 RepID=UPI00298C9139|nr:terminase small subunit [Paenibacillus lycopersici]